MTAPAAATTSKDGTRVYEVDGYRLPSANTVLSRLDKPGLNIWKLKKVAFGVASDPRLQELALDGAEYKAAMSALNDGPNPEAELGTAVHAAIEHWLKGDRQALARHLTWCDDRDAVQAHLDRFIETATEFHLSPVWVEQSVCHLGLEYAGTSDGFVRMEIPGHDECDLVHVYDAKTGKAVYPDVAIQLAAYARAQHRVVWDEVTDQNIIEGPLEGICPDIGIVASVHADRCTMIPMKLGFAWATFVAAREVARWEEVKNSQMLSVLTPPSAMRPW